jgi:hypothetical protein
MTRDYIILVHTILGVGVFATGLLQILLRKGGATHRIFGRLYLYSWLMLLISGAYLGGILISVIGVFGFYFALTGSRIGRLKRKAISWFEKSIFLFGGLVAILMIYYAITLFIGDIISYATIFSVFGILFLIQTVQDISKYIVGKSLKKNIYGRSDWYFEHFTRMFISFIAAVTAFTSIQDMFRNNTLNFLMPTVVGVILINIVKRSYKKKLNVAE